MQELSRRVNLTTSGAAPESDPSRGPVLILGGTAEARALARALVDAGVRVVSSLAGRVRDPALPVGEVRVGGFGGADGLAAWVRDHDVSAVCLLYTSPSPRDS